MKLRIAAFLTSLIAGFCLIQYPSNLGDLAYAAFQTETNGQLQIDNQPNIQSINPANISSFQKHDVIYLGEEHDRPEHHKNQLTIFTQLHQAQAVSGKKLAVGLEMFQRPFQPILDRYLAAEITEAELRTQTEYDARWGFDWEFYAPILRFAQANQIPLIALNTPAEITHKVASTGLGSLEGNDWRYIPPQKEIELDNPEYRQQMTAIYQAHLQAGQGNSSDRDNFYAAQVLWDETMAEAIANYADKNERSQVVVLVGKAHVMYDYAIPNRVARRIKDKDFKQTLLML